MNTPLSVQELIRYCLFVYQNRKNYPISRTTLLKILYKTKRSLSENNSLREELPYYWYKHGPYSSFLDEAVNEMVIDNVVNRVNDNKLVSVKHGRIGEHNVELEEARGLIKKFIDEPTSNSSTTIMEDVYDDYDPCGFYKYFKTQFLGQLNNFYHDPQSRFKPDDLSLTLYNSIGGLPNSSLFSNYKHLFLDFIEAVTEILHSKVYRNFNNKISDTSNFIFFDAFADGIRILEHDRYYDDHIEVWKRDFSNSVNTMDRKITEIYAESEGLVKEINCLTFDKLVRQVLDFKAENNLIKVSFSPPVINEELHDGFIDESIFNNIREDNFRDLLYRFRDSRKATIHVSKKNQRETIDYKIIN